MWRKDSAVHERLQNEWVNSNWFQFSVKKILPLFCYPICCSNVLKVVSLLGKLDSTSLAKNFQKFVSACANILFRKQHYYFFLNLNILIAYAFTL